MFLILNENFTCTGRQWGVVGDGKTHWHSFFGPSLFWEFSFYASCKFEWFWLFIFGVFCVVHSASALSFVWGAWMRWLFKLHAILSMIAMNDCHIVRCVLNFSVKEGLRSDCVLGTGYFSRHWGWCILLDVNSSLYNGEKSIWYRTACQSLGNFIDFEHQWSRTPHNVHTEYQQKLISFVPKPIQACIFELTSYSSSSDLLIYAGNIQVWRLIYFWTQALEGLTSVKPPSITISWPWAYPPARDAR